MYINIIPLLGVSTMFLSSSGTMSLLSLTTSKEKEPSPSSTIPSTSSTRLPTPSPPNGTSKPEHVDPSSPDTFSNISSGGMKSGTPPPVYKVK